MSLLINIVGKPKTGKTVSACTFPKPLLIIDFDRGAKSAWHAKNKADGSLVVKDTDQITIVEFFKHQSSPLIFNTWQLVKGGGVGPAPDHANQALPVVEKYNKLMDELSIDGCVTIDGKKIGPFQTVVLDPLTTQFRIWKDGILSINKIPELRRGDYLTLEGVLANQFIPNLKSLNAIVPYIVCLDHEDFDQSDQGVLTGEYPVGPTKNLGKNLSEFFDEVWRMDIEQNGKYSWRTKSHGLFRGAGSRLDLPDPIVPATYDKLKEYL